MNDARKRVKSIPNYNSACRIHWLGSFRFQCLVGVWSVSGSGESEVNGTRIEPLIAYTAPTATTIGLGAEINYNWEADTWLIPLELSVSQLTILRDHPVQWALGGEYFAQDDGRAPEWGAYFQITFPLDLDAPESGSSH